MSQYRHPRLALGKISRLWDVKKMECPLCGGNTLERRLPLDRRSRRGYFVESCIGGVLRLTVKIDGEVIKIDEDCPYWYNGYEKEMA